MGAHLIDGVGHAVVLAVDHREEHAQNRGRFAHALPHAPHRLAETHDAFQGQVGGRHRDDERVGRHEGVDGEDGGGGGTVDDDRLVLIVHRREHFGKLILPVRVVFEPDVGVGQFKRPGEKVHLLPARRPDGLLNREVVEQHVRRGGREVVVLHSEGQGRRALAVQVHQEHVASPKCKPGGEVHGGRCFSHAALVVDDGNGLKHGRPRRNSEPVRINIHPIGSHIVHSETYGVAPTFSLKKLRKLQIFLFGHHTQKIF